MFQIVNGNNKLNASSHTEEEIRRIAAARVGLRKILPRFSNNFKRFKKIFLIYIISLF